jgi:hypothetical protein
MLGNCSTPKNLLEDSLKPTNGSSSSISTFAYSNTLWDDFSTIG